MFEDHFRQIVAEGAKAAFSYLISLAARQPEYELIPIRHGAIQWAIHWRRRLDERDPFGVIVNQRSLRFYFRRPHEMQPPLTIDAVEGRFPDTYRQKNGAISVRLNIEEDAKLAARLAFPSLWSEGLNPDEFDGVDAGAYTEGAVRQILVNAYERNREARQICVAQWGCKCVVCGLDFEKVYGERGRGFIHVHHLKPLSEIRQKYLLDPENDLRPVCPNCHAMIHRFDPPLSIEDLKKPLLARQMHCDEV